MNFGKVRIRKRQQLADHVKSSIEQHVERFKKNKCRINLNSRPECFALSLTVCVCARAPTHVSGCVRSAYDTGFPSRTVVGSSMLSHGCVVSHCGGHGGRRGQTDAHESRTIQLPSSDPSFPTEVRRRAGWLMNKYHFHSSSFQGHHNCCLSQSIERIYLFIFFFT